MHTFLHVRTKSRGQYTMYYTWKIFPELDFLIKNTSNLNREFEKDGVIVTTTAYTGH